MIWLCRSCKSEFDEPDYVRTDTGVSFIESGHHFYEEYDEEHCPYCGSTNVEEVSQCKNCGGATDDRFDILCPECYRDIANGLKELQHMYKLDDIEFNDVLDKVLG